MRSKDSLFTSESIFQGVKYRFQALIFIFQALKRKNQALKCSFSYD